LVHIKVITRPCLRAGGNRSANPGIRTNLGIVQVDIGQRDRREGVEPEEREVGYVSLGYDIHVVLIAARVVESDEEVEEDFKLSARAGALHKTSA
jgi:hypothetical protein